MMGVGGVGELALSLLFVRAAHFSQIFAEAVFAQLVVTCSWLPRPLFV